MASTSTFGKKKYDRFNFVSVKLMILKGTPNFLFQVKRNTTRSLSKYEIELFETM